MSIETAKCNNEASDSALSDSPGYAVVACRWGWINNGYDILLVTTDKDRAIEKAEWYADYRGGKYGASVYDSDGKEVYHASSSYGEPTMENNNRIDMFERIGNQISGEIETGEEVTHEKASKFYDDAKRICDILSKHNNEVSHGVRHERNCLEPSGSPRCANCRWGMELEHRYDQVHCINENSPEAFGDVEATHFCPLFQANAEDERDMEA